MMLDVYAWMSVLPAEVIEEGWLLVPSKATAAPAKDTLWDGNRTIPWYMLEMLRWFGMEERWVLVDGSVWVQAKRFFTFSGQCQMWFWHPRPIRAFREVAWRGAGAMRREQTQGRVVKRRPSAWRFITNTAEVVETLGRIIPELSWEVYYNEGKNVGEVVRDAIGWRMFLGVEGSNNVGTLFMPPGVLFEIRPCEQRFWAWRFCAAYNGHGYVTSYEVKILHSPTTKCGEWLSGRRDNALNLTRVELGARIARRLLNLSGFVEGRAMLRPPATNSPWERSRREPGQVGWSSESAEW
jgi:hypothetical protein